MKSFCRLLLFFLLIGFVLFCIYKPSLTGGFLWDDFPHVPLVRHDFYGWKGLLSIWTRQGFTQQYYPFLFTTVWIAHHFWGVNPFGYRLLTLVLHALNAVGVWVLLAELGVPAALWAAVLFAVHPLQVDTVAWIAELKNTQSAFFYLPALIFYLRFFRSGYRSKRAYGISFLLFLGALFTKTVSCSLPVVAFLLIGYERRRWIREDVIYLSPFFVTGFCLALKTAQIERNLLGAVGPAWNFSLVERLGIATRAFWFYVGKLLWPHPLLYVYPRWDVHPLDWINLGFWVMTLAAAFLLWRRRRTWGRAPWTAFLVSGVVLFPALGFFNIYTMRYTFVADHYQYLSGIAWIALFSAASDRLACRLKLSAAAQRLTATALCILLAGVSWNRAHAYQSSELLWRDLVNHHPDSLIGNVNLAAELMPRREIDAARPYIYKAAQLGPNDLSAQVALGDLLLHEDHDPQGALAAYQRVWKTIEPLPPSHGTDVLHFYGHSLLGDAYFELHRIPEAIQEYTAALQAMPPLRARPYFDSTQEWLDKNEAAVQAHLGQLYSTEKPEKAIAPLERAVALQPRALGYQLQLAQADEHTGRWADAQAAYLKILAQAPGAWDAHQSLAALFDRQGKWSEAVVQYEDAIDLNPGLTAVRYRLGALLLKLHRSQEAMAVYRAGFAFSSKNNADAMAKKAPAFP